ncbi:MAG: hypothetical protein INR63_27800, partial [Actinomycetospora chiangmaiensis]|nr:hypothetical protein [Actinomycetospora chiangmaiensis]
MDQATPPDARPDTRLSDLLDRIAAGAPLREPGADLAHLSASRDALATLPGLGAAPAADPESGGLPLAGADLSRARMEEA